MSQDILSGVLRNVRLRGAVYFFVNGGASWVAEAPPARDIAAAVMPGLEHVIEYHVVTRGACWAAIVGEEPVRMRKGDIVLFAHGDAHVMSSAPGMRATADIDSYFAHAHEAPFTLRLGDVPAEGAGEAGLVCGFLGCDVRPFNPLVEGLPRMLHLRASEGDDWVAQFMRQAVEESRNRRMGGEVLLERMSEMMFVDAVRRYIDQLPEDGRGWLAGMRDRLLSRVLALIHEDPARPWTVAELGSEVGLSRSALHDRFHEVIGQTPMDYLTNWRMQRAATLLRDTSKTITTVAQDVGYASEAAFTRAFKRSTGKPPAARRRDRG